MTLQLLNKQGICGVQCVANEGQFGDCVVASRSRNHLSQTDYEAYVEGWKR